MALPDILEQLDTTKQPNLDSDSYEHAANLLTICLKDLIGQSVFKYFADANPPGQNAGMVRRRARHAALGGGEAAGEPRQQ